MYLKSLTMKGFKSFADATTLAFEPGVNVVVGPNGSGKSNVVDAIAWVLGMQAPTVVRAQRMDDIVFAGSATRNSLGRAEVSLAIDNHSGQLPIDFTEVTICRSLFRSGQSEYTLNGVNCRLRDITELLADSGIGHTQHTIVSQGQIEETLNASPTALRMILEEAAGMLKHRRRREQAEGQLLSVDTNLTRANDLLREVRRQIKPLKQQAEATQRHAHALNELTVLQQFLAGQEVAELTSRRRDASTQLSEAQDTKAHKERQLATLEEEVSKLEQELQTIGQGDDTDRLAELQTRHSTTRERVAVLKEKISQLEQAASTQSLSATISVTQQQVAQIQSELTDTKNQFEKLVVRATSLAEEEERIRELVGLPDISDQNAGVPNHGVPNHGVPNSGDSELGMPRPETLGSVTPDSGTPESGGPTDPAWHLSKANTLRSSIENRLQTARSAAAEAEADRRHFASRAEALASTIAEARARSGAERLEGFDGVMGTLLELVVVDTGWELAFEAAVEETVAAVVMADSGTALEALRHLKSQSAPGVILAAHASGHTQKGDTREGNTSGQAEVSELAPSLRDKAELLRPHVRSGTAEVEKLLDVLLEGVVVVQEGAPEPENPGPENPAAAADPEPASLVAASLAISHPQLCVVTSKGDRFAKAGSWQIGAQRSGASQAVWEDARQNERSATQRRDSYLEEVLQLEKAMRLSEEIVVGRSEIAVGSARLGERQQALHTQLAERESELEKHRSHHQGAAAAQEEQQRKLELGRSLLDGLQTIAAQLEAELSQASTSRSKQSEQVNALVKKLEELRQARATATTAISGLVDRIQQLNTEETEAAVRLESVSTTLRRDMQMEPRQAMTMSPPPLPDDLNPTDRVAQLQEELRIIGTVNPLALQEYESLHEREVFLETQLQDVKSSRKKLRDIIRTANAEIAAEFMLAFEDVGRNFADFFAKLFPGGKGSLTLTDKENLLETGVEISAQPSDKKVSRLSLLSGGERSLVALAFLFSVFMSRPSPFYVLDEVDAALDQLNIARYLRVLEDFRQESQLVIITHQRLTVEKADCLWGVSMPSGGVSQVVSQRVTESS